MNITQLYKQLTEGKINKSQFLQQARLDPSLKHLITPLMSYDETVRVLKNRRYISEIKKPEISLLKPQLLNESQDKEKEVLDIDKEINKINPTSYTRGLQHELENGAKDIKSATYKVVKNLLDDPLYYANKALKIDVKKSKKKDSHYQKIKKNNLVDKVNQMKAPGKIHEVMQDDKPNQLSQRVTNFIMSNPTLKVIQQHIILQNGNNDNECYLRYVYYDPLPSDCREKLELQFDVQEDTNGVDNNRYKIYIITPKQGGSGKNISPDLGASFNKFKDRLNMEIKNVVNELFGYNEPNVKKN